MPENLAHPYPGAVTVVMQSIVTQYLTAAERHQVLTEVRSAGMGATRQAPVVWLRMEPAARSFELSLSVWPQDVHLTLAEVEAHGRWVKWLDDPRPGMTSAPGTGDTHGRHGARGPMCGGGPTGRVGPVYRRSAARSTRVNNLDTCGLPVAQWRPVVNC